MLSQRRSVSEDMILMPHSTLPSHNNTFQTRLRIVVLSTEIIIQHRLSRQHLLIRHQILRRSPV